MSLTYSSPAFHPLYKHHCISSSIFFLLNAYLLRAFTALSTLLEVGTQLGTQEAHPACKELSGISNGRRQRQ